MCLSRRYVVAKTEFHVYCQSIITCQPKLVSLCLSLGLVGLLRTIVFQAVLASGESMMVSEMQHR